MKNVLLAMAGKNVNVRHANQVDFFVKFHPNVFQNAYAVILKLIVLMEKTNGTVQLKTKEKFLLPQLLVLSDVVFYSSLLLGAPGGYFMSKILVRVLEQDETFKTWQIFSKFERHPLHMKLLWE